MRRLLDYAGIVIFVFKAYSACPATQNAVSLLDFAEIVSSPWVFPHTQIIIFVTLFYVLFWFLFLPWESDYYHTCQHYSGSKRRMSDT